MSNPKHVQLEPEDAAKIAAVLVDVETKSPKYFKSRGLSLQLLRLSRTKGLLPRGAWLRYVPVQDGSGVGGTPEIQGSKGKGG